VRAWWTSDDASERAAAILACRSCPVLADCAAWSLELPAMHTADSAVYGAMTPGRRHKLALERRKASA
jgi:hypothetical protein